MKAPNSRGTETGAAIIESAITLLSFLVLLFGMMEVGRFLNVQQVLTDAAREGARVAVAPITRTDTMATDEEIRAATQQFLDSARLRDTTISIERPVLVPTGAISTEFTRVRVTMDYQVMTLPMFSALHTTIAGEALMRNETSP